MRIGQIGIVAGSQPNLLLDLNTGCKGGYSVARRLRKSATKAIQVRRSSDNATLDIGFIGNNLDTTTLLTFVGVGNGFVSTIYDQSGNNVNVIQSTTTRQPKIVNSGALITKNSKPAMLFDNLTGLNSGFEWVTAAYSGYIFDLYMVGDLNKLSEGTDGRTATVLRDGGHLCCVLYGAKVIVQDGPKFGSVNTQDNIQKLFNTFVGAGNIQTLKINNSVSYTNTSAVTAIPSGNQTFRIGFTSTLTVEGFDGHIQEFIFWNGNQLSNKTAIANNIINYFNISGDVGSPLPFTETFGNNGEGENNGLPYMNFPKSWQYPAEDSDIHVDYPDWIVYNDTDIIPFCNVIGSSGNSFLLNQNTTPGQSYTILSPLSTLNKTSITIGWNGYRSTGAPSTTLDYSINSGTSWVNVSFTDVTANDTWHAKSLIALPIACNNQPLLMLRLGINQDGASTFLAYDDFSILGT